MMMGGHVCCRCDDLGNICVKGMWFCRVHCPVVFTEYESNGNERMCD